MFKFIKNLFKRTKMIVVDEKHLIQVMKILDEMKVRFGRIGDVTDMFYISPNDEETNLLKQLDDTKWAIRMRVNADEWELFVLTAENRELSASISYAYAW